MTWDVTPCSLVQRCQRLEGKCCPCHRSRRWWQHVRPNCQYPHKKIICTLRPLQSPVSHNFYLYRMQVWHAVSPNAPQVPLLQPANAPPPPFRAAPTAPSKGSFRHNPSPKRLICGVAFLDLLPLPLNPNKCNDANVFLEDRRRQSVQTKQKQWTIRYCKFWILFILTPPVVSRLEIRYNKGSSR